MFRSSYVYSVEVVGSECVTALGTLSLPGVISPLNAGIAEHVIALSQQSVYLFHVAAWTRQLGLKHRHKKVNAPIY